ncbi:hypothetical protein KSP40_PGU004840 [Platanthera guangdongensis]|uniref:Uncharacterized protein n=1 Tax=Platanthera guangdongensis TaxID=2320717 RepID=A0ABR2LS14_9ASPA
MAAPILHLSYSPFSFPQSPAPLALSDPPDLLQRLQQPGRRRRPTSSNASSNRAENSA